MRYLVKLNVILLVFTIFSYSQSIAADLIIPLPKPSVDETAKSITEKKKRIYPQKKPDAKKEKLTSSETEEISEVSDESKEKVFIYPQKKPIIVQKHEDKIVAKSSVLSKKDFKIAKSVFEAIDSKKWETALSERNQSPQQQKGYLSP